MKKTIFLIFLSLFILPLITKADGVFSLIDFSDFTIAMEDYNFSQTINFLYSGNSFPDVQYLGYDIPENVKLSSIEYRGTGLYSFSIYGTVNKPGEYNFSLVMTDNYGAMFTQPYTLKVYKRELNILTDSLPDGYFNQPYSATIELDYVGCIKNPSVTGLPNGMTYEYVDQDDDVIYSDTDCRSGKGQIVLSGVINDAERVHYVKVEIKILGNPQTEISKTIQLHSKDRASVVVQENKITNVDTQQDTENQTNNDFLENEKAKIVSIDEELSEKLKGKILLQVENHGEAWYVNSADGKRNYMADGSEAYNIMRDLGIGITNVNLEKIKNDTNFAKNYSGKIFLQVEDLGQAYYIDFDGEAHYLQDGAAAYDIMRDLGLGITNDDLNKIDIAI